MLTPPIGAWRLRARLPSASTEVERWSVDGPSGEGELFSGPADRMSSAHALPAWGPFPSVERFSLGAQQEAIVVEGALSTPLAALSLEPEAGVAMAWHLAAALAEVHSRGEAHGALHPDFIGLDPSQKLVIRPALSVPAGDRSGVGAQAADCQDLADVFEALGLDRLGDPLVELLLGGLRRTPLRLQPASAVRQALSAVLARHREWEEALVAALGEGFRPGVLPRAERPPPRLPPPGWFDNRRYLGTALRGGEEAAEEPVAPTVAKEAGAVAAADLPGPIPRVAARRSSPVLPPVLPASPGIEEEEEEEWIVAEEEPEAEGSSGVLSLEIGRLGIAPEAALLRVGSMKPLVETLAGRGDDPDGFTLEEAPVEEEPPALISEPAAAIDAEEAAPSLTVDLDEEVEELGSLTEAAAAEGVEAEEIQLPEPEETEGEIELEDEPIAALEAEELEGTETGEVEVGAPVIEEEELEGLEAGEVEAAEPVIEEDEPAEDESAPPAGAEPLPIDHEEPPIGEHRPPLDHGEPPIDQDEAPVNQGGPSVDAEEPPVDAEEPQIDEEERAEMDLAEQLIAALVAETPRESTAPDAEHVEQADQADQVQESEHPEYPEHAQVALESVESTEPAEPAESVEQVESVEPVEPVESAEADEAAEAAESAEPAEAEEVAEPAEAAEPVEAEETAVPAEAVEAEKTAEPAEAEEAEEAAVPAEAEEAAEAAEPAEPEEAEQADQVRETQDAPAAEQAPQAAAEAGFQDRDASEAEPTPEAAAAAADPVVVEWSEDELAPLEEALASPSTEVPDEEPPPRSAEGAVWEDPAGSEAAELAPTSEEGSPLPTSILEVPPEEAGLPEAASGAAATPEDGPSRDEEAPPEDLIAARPAVVDLPLVAAPTEPEEEAPEPPTEEPPSEAFAPQLVQPVEVEEVPVLAEAESEGATPPEEAGVADEIAPDPQEAVQAEPEAAPVDEAETGPLVEEIEEPVPAPAPPLIEEPPVVEASLALVSEEVDLPLAPVMAPGPPPAPLPAAQAKTPAITMHLPPVAPKAAAPERVEPFIPAAADLPQASLPPSVPRTPPAPPPAKARPPAPPARGARPLPPSPRAPKPEEIPAFLSARGVTGTEDRESELGAGKWTEPARSLEQVQRELPEGPVRELDLQPSRPRWPIALGVAAAGLLAVFGWRLTQSPPEEGAGSTVSAAVPTVMEAVPSAPQVSVLVDPPATEIWLDDVAYGASPAVVPVPTDSLEHQLCVLVGGTRTCRGLTGEALAFQDPYRFVVEIRPTP